MAGDRIRELERKLLYIAETFSEIGQCASISIDALAKFAQVSRETLRGAVDRGTVSKELEALLAEKCGFDPSDLTWKDTRIDYASRMRESGRYFGLDTAENFRRTHRVRHDRPVLGNLTLKGHRPETLNRNLGSIEINAAQTSLEDLTLPILMSILMGRVIHESGLVYGFNRVRVRFDFPQASVARFSSVLASRDNQPIGTGTIRAEGGEYEVVWYVSSARDILRGEFVTSDSPLCELVDLSVGDEFDVDLSVCPYDGDIEFAEASLTTSNEQNAIIKALMAERLPADVNTDGWLSLGRQHLQVVRA